MMRELLPGEMYELAPSLNKKGGQKRFHFWLLTEIFCSLNKALRQQTFKFMKVKRRGKRYAVLYGSLGKIHPEFIGHKGYIFVKYIQGD